eukprot:1471754-Amphidinium_carterae.1
MAKYAHYCGVCGEKYTSQPAPHLGERCGKEFHDIVETTEDEQKHAHTQTMHSFPSIHWHPVLSWVYRVLYSLTEFQTMF